jgi:hypothetical protein
VTGGDPAANGGRVNRLRRFHLPTRLLLAALLALCLGVRVLTPVGFMPSFASGSLAIVPCPDADGAPSAPPTLAMHHMDGMAMADMATRAPVHDHDHGKNPFHHQSCPYASASSLSGLDSSVVILAVIVLLALLPPLARSLPTFRRRATRDRPPAQGPPLPA